MLKKWKSKKLLKNEKGLTLVELLAVIVILAIIAAIAVPAIGNIINKSKDRAILAEASNILAGAKIAYIDGACGKTAPDNKCDKDELKEFVDGIELGANDEVEYNETDKKWIISYARFSEIKTGGLKVAESGGNTSIDEAELNKKLKSAGIDKEGTE
ncbi:prepilin-type N-terminal cleavage/methylation domain-containing protein [Lysinibacillus capsici]|uniref:prepilin-type N-terminal cleavage/methylation domain-containing protein n=1 Tax=Lysinibacillus capsici TaxID=2115968 RepID=UPI002A810E2E|nr:prepilin-type N-terminal cleavage/methylation domain-containing protein [Lysinibacillus capsici]